MPTIAPWLQPQDWIQAMNAGATAGLQRSRIFTDANEAAGRLGLGYAQLAAEQNANTQRAAIAREQAAEELSLKKLGMDDLNSYRTQQLADKDREIGIHENLAAAELMKKASGEKLTKGLSEIFSTSGKTRDEINKVVTANPEAASTLTGPQWDYLLGPKQSEPTVSIPVPSGNAIQDLQGINQPRISGQLNKVLPLLGTNLPPAFRNIRTSEPQGGTKQVGKYKVTPIN